MSQFINKDMTIVAGNASTAIDLSGYSNSFSLAQSVAELDSTVFTDLVRRRVGGILDGSFSVSSFGTDTDDPRATLATLFGDPATVFAVVKSNASMAEGDTAVFGQVLPNLERNHQHAEIEMLTLSGNASQGVIVGKVLQPDTAAISSTSTSTGFELGAVATGQSLWAAQIVVATTGSPTLDTVIQSDVVGFGSPTTRITFSQATGLEAQYSVLAGPVATDTYYRISYTFGGTGSITVLVVAGIY